MLIRVMLTFGERCLRTFAERQNETQLNIQQVLPMNIH